MFICVHCHTFLMSFISCIRVLICVHLLVVLFLISCYYAVYLLFFFFGQFPLLGVIVYFHNLFNWWSSVSWPWRVSSNLRLLLSPFPSSLLAKNFAAGCFWNVMRTAHTCVSRILDRLHLPQKTSGFPTSPPPTVTYCFRGCNYIFLHAAAKAGPLVSDFPVSSPMQCRRSQICLRPSLWRGLRWLRLNCLAAPLGLEAAGWALRQSLLFEQRWIALKLGFCSWRPQADSFITSQRLVQITWNRCSLICLVQSPSRKPLTLKYHTEPTTCMSTCRHFFPPCDLLLLSTWHSLWRLFQFCFLKWKKMCFLWVSHLRN